MSIRQFILENKPSLNTTVYLTCPKCSGYKKLGVTNKAGKLLFQCLRDRCNLRGCVEYDRSLRDLQAMRVQQEKKPFVLPDRIIRGVTSQAVKDYLISVNAYEAYTSHLYDVGYDPAEDRVVYMVKEGASIVGAVGRAMKDGVIPKALTYANSESVPFICGTGNTVVVVEDCASACSIARVEGHAGLALLGTSFKAEYHRFLKSYDTIVVALDADAWKNNLRLKRWLSLMYPNKVVCWTLDKDLKDMDKDTIVRNYVNA